jgi:carbonic anhydrase
LVFDQGIGDLFVARVAGNGATGKLAESLYYGTAILGTLVIFVLGHSDCGAVKEAVAEYPKHPLEFVKLIFPAVKQARRIVKESGGNPNDPTHKSFRSLLIRTSSLPYKRCERVRSSKKW